MTVVSFLTLIFVIFRIIARVTWFVLALGVVTHIVFGRLTDFIFLPLRPPVLSSLLHPRHRFLSDIIAWVIFVVLNYLHCFVEDF
jgi:hypothetical protein